jgi:hypothetical protein
VLPQGEGLLHVESIQLTNQTHTPGISLMINSYCVRILTSLFVRLRVDTTSSAAFLQKDANRCFCLVSTLAN